MNNQQSSGDAREKKRAQFASDSAKPKSKVLPVIIVAATIAVAVAAYVVMSARSDNPAATPVNSSNQTLSGDVRIPLAELANGQAKFFDYALPGNKQVRFFAIKSSDGQYRAALDACDTCFHSKKGYRQEGNEMVCNNCGLSFDSNGINIARGGCNPVGLERIIEGDHLVIKASALELGGRYF